MVFVIESVFSNKMSCFLCYQYTHYKKTLKLAEEFSIFKSKKKKKKKNSYDCNLKNGCR